MGTHPRRWVSWYNRSLDLSKIALLDKTVADKIAAGEVVERPASVIKELLENSIDAGASNIFINLQQGGHKLMEVCDDGEGMTADEAKLAILRFATSKINTWEDLEKLSTFGFRGEALPSIAAVSRMEILTSPGEGTPGTRLFIEGGHLKEVSDAGLPQGTTIRVQDLFFNTPARRKFLKSPAAETSHIIGIAQKLSLVNPELGLRLKSNGRTIFDFPRDMTLRERILKIWGQPLDYRVVSFDEKIPGLRVWGFACPPDALKSHRSYQLFFVNRRYIKNTMINQAVSEGFSPLLPAGKFPMVLVFIEMPGEDLDVNVHPNKMEVRFIRPGRIFKEVRDAIKRQLRSFGFVPEPRDNPADEIASMGEAFHPRHMNDTWPRTSAVPPTGAIGKTYRKEEVSSDSFQSSYHRRVSDTGGELSLEFEEEALTEKPKARLLGGKSFCALAQLQNTYIIGQAGDELWIIDQHTAHERINYERLGHMGKNMSRSQRLLFPMVLELPASLHNFVIDSLSRFDCLGFEMESFGGTSILVKAIPYGFDRLEKHDNLMNILEEVAEGYPYRNLDQFTDRLRSTVACKASVRAGDPLSFEEMNSLVNELVQMDFSNFCPHGRPVVIKFSRDHLDRMFHRK